MPFLHKSGEGINLSWLGGHPPFLIQQSKELSTWSDLDRTEDRAYTLSSPGVLGFFRVQGSQEIDLGEFYGQWRIAEGEFGLPLAKHRLKSVWDWHLPEDGPALATAEALFTKATVRVQYLDESVLRVFTGRLEELPDALLTIEDRKITASWTWGEGERKRDMSLEMTFRYNVDALRFSKVNLSDPSITLTANYHSPVASVDNAGKLSMIMSETADLVEIDDTNERPAWWNRKIQFTKSDITIDSQFAIGVPNIEGGPAFIFKTPLLVSWEGTTVSGLASQPIQFESRFSQTYEPFHHNFVETLWLEPALEPGINPEILKELHEKNIRFIVPQNPSAFPEQNPTLRVFGFDNSIREL